MSRPLTKAGLAKSNHETLDTLALEKFATPLPEGLTKDEKVEMLLQMQQQAQSDEQDLPANSEIEPALEPKSSPENEVIGHVYVRIANQEGVGGDQPVFLQVNGFSALIHREKWVKLRTFFLPSLKHAVETHFFQREDGTMESKEVRRFNVEVRTLDQGVPNDDQTLSVL